MLTICHNYFRIYPNNKPNKDAAPQNSKKKFVFGIFILLLVDVVWVVSSELTKFIYTEKKLERPFLITYIRSSFLFVYLLVLCFIPPTKDPCRPADYTQLLEPTNETDDESYFNESSSSLGDSTFVPVRAGEITDSDDAAPRAVRFNKVAEVRVMSAAQAGEALLARLSWTASLRASEHAQRRAAAMATRRHLKMAVLLCMPWFISNYLYRLSLLHSATSSATVYLSTSGAFAITLGSMFAYSSADKFTLTKCVAILFTAGGLVLLGVSEKQNNWIAVLAALGSGFTYSIHLLLFRRELWKGDLINCPLLVGLIGCACAGFGCFGGGALAASGIERATLPSPPLLAWLLLDAALAPLLLDWLWLWGKSLTSSQTATCMLALCMPLAWCADAWRGSARAGWAAAGAAGALAAAGWALAALDSAPGHRRLSLPPAPLSWLRTATRDNQGFTALRNIPELDEQSEALISSEEPT